MWQRDFNIRSVAAVSAPLMPRVTRSLCFLDCFTSRREDGHPLCLCLSVSLSFPSRVYSFPASPWCVDILTSCVDTLSTLALWSFTHNLP